MPDIPAQIGSCTIQREIGRGGMGVVYLARDTSLDRDVAVKVLPVELARDETRRTRFQRESKLLGSLHHSNIAAVYGLEEVDGRPFLLMEYVEGQTLRERLDKGSLPLEEAMQVAVQIAQALEAAHARGIVHRDLKPSNVKFAANGTAKVLDFGLARSLNPEILATTQLEHSRTTEVGTAVGTPGYMSPEQLRGVEVDERTDIWAFGCVLYEMITGRGAFATDTSSESIGAALHLEPDWDALPGRTPPTVRLLLHRCLTKDPDQRLHHIANARIELKEALADPAGTVLGPAMGRTSPQSGAPTPGYIWAIATAGVVAAGLAAWGWLRPSPVTANTPTRLVLEHPPGERFVDIALSPDGRILAYASRPTQSEGPAHLYLRSMDTWDVRHVPESANANNLFFHPNGQWIGFFASGKLLKVRVAGGRPQTVCDVPTRTTGATWLPDRGDGELIVFGQLATGLTGVPVQGGDQFELTELQPGEGGHWSPHYLSGNTVLFSIGIGARLRLQALDVTTGEYRPVALAEADPLDTRYLPTGHLLYAQRDGLWAVGFDAAGLRMTTPPRWEVGEVGLNLDQRAVFSVSASGTLAYVPGSGSLALSHLVTIDSEGHRTPLFEQEGNYIWPNVSPDGTKVAYQTQDGDIWVLDLERGTRLRVTEEKDRTSIWPVWTADSTALTFASNRAGLMDIYQERVDGSDATEEVLVGGDARAPTSWLRDEVLGYVYLGTRSGLDLWMLRGDETEPFATTVSNESMMTFSPDGKWIAYVSDGTGHNEVYVTAYPATGPGLPISAGGGTEPVWSADSETLYFRNGIHVMAVSTGDDIASFGTPEPVLEAYFPSGRFFANYDVLPDGRFVIPEPVAGSRPEPVHVVLDWFAELEERLPWK